MLPCQRHTATLVVEVGRCDGVALSAPATVRLRGAAERTAATAEATGRVTFAGLDPGAYRVDVALGGDEAEFVVTTQGHEAITLAANASTAVRVEVDAEDSELVAVAFEQQDDLLVEGAGVDPDDDPDDWELVAASLAEDAPTLRGG